MVAPVGKTVDSEASADVATDIMPATTISAMRMGRLGPQDTFITSSICYATDVGTKFPQALLILAFDIRGMLSVDYEFMNTYSQRWRRRAVGSLCLALLLGKVPGGGTPPGGLLVVSSGDCWSVRWPERRAG